MTADEYRAARQLLGLKQAELAKHLGVTTNTVSRRELGLVPISREADIAIKCLVLNVECYVLRKIHLSAGPTTDGALDFLRATE